LAEEIILWSNQQFKFVTLPDDLATGSSIMPQKKNPDGAELVRSQAANSISHLNNILIILKGLPLAYSKDMQDDKKLVFNSFDTVHLCLQVMTELMSKIKFNTYQMKNAVDESYAASTDLANWLVQNLGYSFRHAYQLTAKIVSYAIKKNKILEALTLGELQQFDGHISASILKNLSSTNSMRNNTSYGGTSPQSVKKSIQYAIKKYL
jgi:argininosuccinate lyase